METINMKAIVVTGAAGGMGEEICKRLAADGYKVYGLDCRDFSLENVTNVRCDIRCEEDVKRAVERIAESGGEIYGLIHAAGVYDLDSLVEMDEERFKRIFDINLFGVYRVTKAMMPYLRQGSRVVIVTSELAPLDPLPFTGIYGITKTALEKFAFSLRMELNLVGISVSVIRPGAVRTGLLGDSTAALDRFCEKTKIYKCNAERFKRIVESVEAKNVHPKRVAALAERALLARRPRYVYNLNRNPLLRILSALPQRLQVMIIGLILK